MSEVRRIIPMLIDIEQGLRVEERGPSELAVASSNQIVWRSTQLLFRCKLLMGNQDTPFTPPANASWLFGIDSTYTAGKTDLVISDNDKFNIIGDWDDLDVAGGKICWRADLTTSALIADLGDKESKTMYAALWMLPSGEKPVLMSEWDIIVRNIAVDPTTAIEEEGIVFDTINRADATYQKQWADGASIKFKNGQHPYIYIAETGLWYPLVGEIVDGSPVIGLGTGEA